jgi:hypothetical protein
MGSEREQIVKWLRDESRKPHEYLDGPKWRAVLWAIMHPFKFGYFGGKVLFAIEAAKSIERGDHLTTERTDNGGQHE